MPRFDKTGPEGNGPKTGRQMGKCKGAKPIAGRGLGRGKGFAWRARAFQAIPQPQIIAQPQVITKVQEKQILEQELEAIKAEQTEIQARLKELK